MEQPTNNLKDVVLSKIEAERVEPCARWSFVCRNLFFIIATIVSVVVGALAVATMIFTSLNAGWEYYDMTHDNLVTFAVDVLPFMWAAILVGMASAAYYNLRHTKRGYRYSVAMVLGLIVGASVLGGGALYVAKAGYVMDTTLYALMPQQYRSAMMNQKMMWHSPEQGRYFGVIASTSQHWLWLTDIEDITWQVDTSVLRKYDHELVIPQSEVRLIGVQSTSSNVVTGCLVLPGVSEMPMRIAAMRERRAVFQHRLMEVTPPERNLPPGVILPRNNQVFTSCRELLQVTASKVPVRQEL